MQNLSTLASQVRQLCQQVGSWIAQQAHHFQQQQIEYKGRNDLVSYVDKHAEEKLLHGLHALLPEANILSEETHATCQLSSKGSYWIVDPLDGTTNFVHGIPVYAISVALMHEGTLVVGVVYEINRQECFYAWQGGGAYLNDNPLVNQRTASLAESLVATGFPYQDRGLSAHYLTILNKLITHTRGVRRLGAAAVDLAYVAAGRFDAFYEYNLQPWDVAAGALLVLESGGSVTDFFGNSNFLTGGSILACRHTQLHKQMLDIIQPVWLQATTYTIS